MADTQGLTAMELERARRIEENKARMALLGLTQAVDDIKASMAAKRAQARQQRAAHKAVAGPSAPARVRRSARVEGKPAPNYNENAMILALADGNVADKHDRRLLKENTALEVYGLRHLEALGDHGQPWELFVDGYDASGNRIYDKVNGATCHQCRQKTLGKRTSCAGCKSLQGVFCGDCLFMRYGENVDEVIVNPAWVCPLCRDLCNCSFHRSKRGWAPTGTLYRRAAAEGYNSVAHYLVLNNLSAEAKPHALEMAPPELRAQLEEEIKQEAAASAVAAEEGAAAVQEQLLALDAEPTTSPAAKATKAMRKRKATTEAAAAPAGKAKSGGKVAPPAAGTRRGLRSAAIKA